MVVRARSQNRTEQNRTEQNRFSRSDLALKGRHLFDWTLLTEHALINTLRSNFTNVYKAGNLKVHEDGPSKMNTVMDHGSGIMFHHLFTRDEKEIVDQETIDREYEKWIPKVSHMVAKMQSVMAFEGHIFFIRRWQPNKEITLNLIDAIRGLRGDRPFTLVSVLYEPTQFVTDQTDPHLIEYTIPGERQFQIDAWRPLFTIIKSALR